MRTALPPSFAIDGFAAEHGGDASEEVITPRDLARER